ncbi:MAG TPA: thermonuclease family protein [Gaiellales bacterium]|nr:thermonuclease family protein [Gaiellales bacterium]
MNRVLPVLVLVALVTAGWLWARGEGPPPTQGTVARVVDGDTVIVRAGSRTLDVRLLGIDTPETVDPRRPVGCYGPEASAYTKHLLTGRQVRLVYDRQLHDVYGRWLAYIYLQRPGRSDLFVNARLIAAGYARTLSIPPNTAHASELAALERRAALAGAGLWSACG